MTVYMQNIKRVYKLLGVPRILGILKLCSLEVEVKHSRGKALACKEGEGTAKGSAAVS